MQEAPAGQCKCMLQACNTQVLRAGASAALPLIVGAACLLLGLAFYFCRPQSVSKAPLSAAAFACRPQLVSEAAVPRGNIRGEVPAVVRSAQPAPGLLQPDMLHLNQPCVRSAQAERPGLEMPPCQSSHEGCAGRCTAQEQLHPQSPWQAESEAELEARLAGQGIWQPDVWEQGREAAEAQGRDVGDDSWHEAEGVTGTSAGARGLTGRDALRGQSSRLQGGASRMGASRAQT